ncbi:MAG: hypothetical protein NUW01_12535 [Gemmatimonadaceae bacterium]|nr:hypothetical protein [Gemmatimonadaceae bacterium]
MKWKIFTLLAVCAALPVQAEAQGRSNRSNNDGLTRIELLALQQEMRDRGCGNKHAPGVMTAETRRAIANCGRRAGVTGARALLRSFNNGFGNDDNPPPERNDKSEVVGELGTHPVRAGEANRATPATRATPAVPARDGRPATPAKPATPATPARKP